MSLSELLKTPQSLGVSDKSGPFEGTKPWEPGLKHNGDDTITLTEVSEAGEGEKFDDILAKHGFDSKRYMLTPNGVQVKSWEALRRVWVEDDSERGGHHETEKVPMRGQKFTIIERPFPVDVDELIELVENGAPVDAPARAFVSNGVYVWSCGDTQFFKMDGDGIEGQVARFHEVVDAGVKEAWADARVDSIVLVFTGDMCEGMVSQGGKNMWRTTGDLTTQLRLMRRMYFHAINSFVEAGFRNVKVVAVPGNHGDTVRQPVQTRMSDNYDTDCLVAVADAMALDPKKYGGVECFVPGDDEWYVALDIGGKGFVFQHGHQYRPGRHWEYWSSQALAKQGPYAHCDVMWVGHGHHYVVEEKGTRTFIMNPALENVSRWWQSKTGDTGHPGAVAGIVIDGELEQLHKIHAKYRGEGAV